jgi:glutamine synthetase adenylyltransferase
LFSLLLFSVHIFLPVFLQPAATCEKIRQGHMRKSNILIKITKPRVYLRLTNRRPQNAAAVIFLLDNSSMFGYNVLARSRNDAA